MYGSQQQPGEGRIGRKGQVYEGFEGLGALFVASDWNNSALLEPFHRCICLSLIQVYLRGRGQEKAKPEESISQLKRDVRYVQEVTICGLWLSRRVQ